MPLLLTVLPWVRRVVLKLYLVVSVLVNLQPPLRASESRLSSSVNIIMVACFRVVLVEL